MGPRIIRDTHNFLAGKFQKYPTTSPIPQNDSIHSTPTITENMKFSFQIQKEFNKKRMMCKSLKKIEYRFECEELWNINENS